MASGNSNFKVDKAVIQGMRSSAQNLPQSCFPEEIFSDKANAAFPQGAKLVQAEQYGHSAWSSTARLTAQNEDGSSSDFFLKVVTGTDAEERVKGEYLSMLNIFNTVPSLVPQPRGYGKCLESDGFFFFCDYKEIDHRTPDPNRLGERLSELHLKSRGKSPNGKFGSDHVPYDGKLPLLGEWDDSWLSFFTKLMKLSYEHDIRANGHWQELDGVMQTVFNKLIPRLLGPLEGNIEPCLIHGDLWEENIGTDINTNELYIIDAAAYYAHNEKEIGIWRCDHHQMKSKEYIKQYLKHFEPDEPTEEFDDRNLLYSVQTKFMNCGHMPGTIVRAQLLEDLKYLTDKYLGGDDNKPN